MIWAGSRCRPGPGSGPGPLHAEEWEQVHIYATCGVSTRAGLAMFAMRHGLAARTGPAAAEID